MRPEVLGAGVEVRRELQHRVAQLIGIRCFIRINLVRQITLKKLGFFERKFQNYSYSDAFEVEDLVLGVVLDHGLGELWDVVP